MGLACSCKSEALVQLYHVQKHNGKMQLKNSKNAIQVWVWVQVWTRKGSNVVNSMGRLGALDTENASKQQSNNTQGAVMHSGSLSKKTH